MNTHLESRCVAAFLAALVGVGATLTTASPAAAAPVSGPALGWGDNSVGQLGVGSTSRGADIPLAVHLPDGVRVSAVAAGYLFSLALTSTGQVLAWGSNYYGQLGNGTQTDSTTPVPVSLPQGTDVVGISAGIAHGLALTSTGQVFAWGRNSEGQLGIGTTSSGGCQCVESPVLVPTASGTAFTRVSGGGEHSLALTSTGQVWAWGYNAGGELGTGSPTIGGCYCVNTPVQTTLPSGTTVTAISAGWNHNLALTSAGRVLAWGVGGSGALGYQPLVNNGWTPQPVGLPGGATASVISAGALFSLAVTSSGGLLAWGKNSHGQLGDGTTTDRTLPVAVALPSGTTVTGIAAKYAHSVALTSTGGLLAWGGGGFGKLGNGGNKGSPLPVPVSLPAGSRISSLAPGCYAVHSLAIESARGAVVGYGLSPSPIAPRGSLRAGTVVSVTVSPEDNLGAIPGATVYLSFRPAVGGGSARVGSTQLTSTPAPFVADATGRIVVTYEAPGALPSTGKDNITAQNARGTPTVARTDSYNFAP
jgi:alpha-tubulin suppressor-like RCC1 family protein